MEYRNANRHPNGADLHRSLGRGDEGNPIDFLHIVAFDCTRRDTDNGT